VGQCGAVGFSPRPDGAWAGVVRLARRVLSGGSAGRGEVGQAADGRAALGAMACAGWEDCCQALTRSDLYFALFPQRPTLTVSLSLFLFLFPIVSRDSG